MSDAAERNRLIKSLLTSTEAKQSGSKLHAERVAVYAVATAEYLGFGDEDLVTARFTAELLPFPKLPKKLGSLVQTEGPIHQIVRLCDQFVSAQSIGGQGLSWLQYEAFHHFDRKYVAALCAIEPLISPAEIV